MRMDQSLQWMRRPLLAVAALAVLSAPPVQAQFTCGNVNFSAGGVVDLADLSLLAASLYGYSYSDCITPTFPQPALADCDGYVGITTHDLFRLADSLTHGTPLICFSSTPLPSPVVEPGDNYVDLVSNQVPAMTTEVTVTLRLTTDYDLVGAILPVSFKVYGQPALVTGLITHSVTPNLLILNEDLSVPLSSMRGCFMRASGTIAPGSYELVDVVLSFPARSYCGVVTLEFGADLICSQDATTNTPAFVAVDWHDMVPTVVNNVGSDPDADLAPDPCDNCATMYNPDQADVNSDGRGDACDNTQIGTIVNVDLGNGVELTFDNVTQNGWSETTTSSTGPDPDPGWAILPSSPSPQYFYITSNALFTGEIEVCINYNPAWISGNEADLKLWHYDGGSWVNTTTSIDVTNDIICGTTTSLSPFALMMPICCVGTRGNVNNVGGVDISDLSLLIAYMTTTPKPPLPCFEEANVNGISGVDLSDLSLLISYLTTTPQPALPNCP